MQTANDGTVHRLPEPSFRLAAQQCIGGIGAGVLHYAASPGRNITYASTPNDFKPREPYGDRLQSDGSAAVRPVRAGPLGLSMSHKQSAMQVYYAARASEYELIYLKPERQT